MNDNIVVAEFSSWKKTQTRRLWQYDYGQVLKITGLELPHSFEVHFSNTKDGGNATTSIGNADGVAIPDVYLTTGSDIYAWIFLHTGESDGETKYLIVIPVRPRAKPSDAEPTPQQQSTITQTIAAINQVMVDVEAAVGSTTAASTSAADAAGSAIAAANTAIAKADEASLSATTTLDAKSAAQSAQAAAEAAQGKAETAQTAAEVYASNADNSATRAEQAANNLGYMEMEIVNGHLIYRKTELINTDFELVNGHLIMEVM